MNKIHKKKLKGQINPFGYWHLNEKSRKTGFFINYHRVIQILKSIS